MYDSNIIITDVIKYNFANRVVNIWNSLPNDIDSAPSVSSFCVFFFCLGYTLFVFFSVFYLIFSLFFFSFCSSPESIRERVMFKVACPVRQSLSGQAPLYLADDCCLVSDSTRRSLWSADLPTHVVPQTLSSYSDRTSAAAGPRL